MRVQSSLGNTECATCVAGWQKLPSVLTLSGKQPGIAGSIHAQLAQLTRAAGCGLTAADWNRSECLIHHRG